MTIRRRDFLKISSAACIGSVIPMATAKSHRFDGWPDRYGMLTDTTLCIGANCRKCELACKRVNELDLDVQKLSDNSVFDRQRRTDSDNYTVVNRFSDPENESKAIYVKQQCMHCNEPACASACLVKAFTKTPEGPVTYNPDVCIGCRYCMVACPFYIPSYDYFDALTPEVRKCTMCYSRVKEGKIPACAEMCPEEAITFGRREDLINLAREKIRNNPDRYQSHIYGEEEVGGTSWLYLAGTDFGNIGFQTDLITTPYPDLTRGFLSAVPLVLTIWPALLVGFYKFTKNREESESASDTESRVGGAE